MRIPTLLTLGLWAVLTLPCCADYTYGGTELSWEWLTDASRAVVVGPVTSVDDDGFVLKVERVLKRRGLAVDQGKLVGGTVLGRSAFYEQAPLQREIGWPALSDATTYPNAEEIRDRGWRPRIRRQETWARGDRCLVFYGQDLQSPLQIINLDKPVTIEVEFLAIDLVGQPVTRAKDLIQRIEDLIAATQDDRGRPRVRSAAINYTPPNSPLDYHSYYKVLAPPDKKLAEPWQPEILTGSANLATESISHPAGKELGNRSMAPQAVWYWFFAGKSVKDFAANAQQERNAAVRTMFGSESAEQHVRRRVARHGVLDHARYQVYRQH